MGWERFSRAVMGMCFGTLLFGWRRSELLAGRVLRRDAEGMPGAEGGILRLHGVRRQAPRGCVTPAAARAPPRPQRRRPTRDPLGRLHACHAAAGPQPPQSCVSHVCARAQRAWTLRVATSRMPTAATRAGACIFTAASDGASLLSSRLPLAWPGLAWPGLAWPGLASCLAWPIRFPLAEIDVPRWWRVCVRAATVWRCPHPPRPSRPLRQAGLVVPALAHHGVL